MTLTLSVSYDKIVIHASLIILLVKGFLHNLIFSIITYKVIVIFVITITTKTSVSSAQLSEVYSSFPSHDKMIEKGRQFKGKKD